MLYLSDSWLDLNDESLRGEWFVSTGPEAGGFATYLPFVFNQADDVSSCAEEQLQPDHTLLWSAQNCSAVRPYIIEYECAAGYRLTLAGCQCLSSILRLDLAHSFCSGH